MKKSAFKLVSGSAVAIFIALHLFCVGLDSPSSPNKTNASVVLMSSTSKIYEGALVDSVGKEIWIGTALYLPANFDSVEIEVLDDGNTVIDTVFRTFRSEYFKDTVWVKHTFLKPGVKNVTITPYSTPECPSLGATITIRGIEIIPEDKTPPVITFVSPTDTNAIISTDTFTIDLLCSDPSGVASVSADMGSRSFQSILKNGHYLITVAGFTRGVVNVVTVSATDSSVPGNTASRKLYLTVQDSISSKYKVVYNGNGNTGGTIPVDSNSYVSSTVVTVKENTGSLTKTGATFTGWNTAVDGSGTAYLGGISFVMGSADVILFAQWTTSSTFTVTYKGNGNSAGAPPVDANKYELSALVTVKDNTGSLVKPGATFTGWNTMADGSGIRYPGGVTFVMGSADVVLYAQWTTNPTFTVTYKGNGNSGGSVPVDANRYETAATVIVRGNVGSLAKTGATFRGWNTLVDGSGTAYSGGDTFPMSNVDVVLYAQWTTTATFTVTYDGNGNTSGAVPADANKYETAAVVTVKSNEGLLAKTGATFTGWNTAVDGSGTAYAGGVTFAMGSANIILYAQWTSNTTFTVTYNGNGNTTGTVPVDSNKYETAATVTVNGNTGTLSKPGFTFTGWNTAVDGSGTAYAGGVTFAMGSANIILYAQWTSNPTFTVTYNGNGNTTGSVPVDSNKYETTATVTVKGNTGTLSKPGFTFTGWNTAVDGSGTAYAGGVTFAMGSANIILYAQWTTNPTFTVTYNGNGNTTGSVPVDSNKYETAATVAVKGNTGSLAKPGVSFKNWNTALDGSGTAYSGGVTFAMGSADVILYAQWAVNRYTVTFNSVEGSAVASQTVDHGGKITVPTAPTRTGYTFGGWYTETAYTTQWNFTTGTVTANDTLFAKWIPVSYTVTFDGQSIVANSTKVVTFPKTTVETLPAPTAAGYQFGGWFTSINGGGTPFLATTTVTSDITVFAKWTQVYKVTYNVNTGDGTPPVDPNTYPNGSIVSVKSGSGLSKAFYTFAGWNTQADTLGTSYTGGGTFPMGSADVVLYAKWRMNVPTISTLSNKTCPVNDSVTFTVTATGASLSYVWQLNNAPISGATSSSYTTSKLTKDDVSAARTYKCVVTNPAGSANSSATLAVSTVNDVDNNVYHEVRIGTQIWMMENLKTTRYRDGSRINTQATDAIDWEYNYRAYAWPEYNESNKAYGMLYNLNCVEGGQLAPTGWRLPTEAEWTTLFSNDGCVLYDPNHYNVGIDWGCPSNLEPNATGFTAMANGLMYETGDAGYFKNTAYWWTAETTIAGMYYSRSWSKGAGSASTTHYGYGIRCIKE